MTYGANPPDITKTAFECPHCGAYTSQTWFKILADRYEKGAKPLIPKADWAKWVNSRENLPEERKAEWLEWGERMKTRLPFFKYSDTSFYGNAEIENLFLSSCFVCGKPSLWVHDAVIFPPMRDGAAPHADMPDDIRHDFEEARGILGRSPRGAAGLLRLCIQKLCDDLGQTGKKIDDAIAGLVAAGLDPTIQQALDSVRVIGNEAVHPGSMDLRDDQATALKLLELVNIIVDRMISHPKKVKEIYAGLPESKRKAIDDRNAKATAKGAPAANDEKKP